MNQAAVQIVLPLMDKWESTTFLRILFAERKGRMVDAYDCDVGGNEELSSD